MKRELSPDPSAVGGGGAALPGSAELRAPDAKVPRLEDPRAGALDRPPGHDASTTIARSTHDEHPASPPGTVAPSAPFHPLSPTMTSAQMAARVIAAATEQAAGVAVDELGPARAAPVVDARAEQRQIAVAEKTENARSPEAVAATTAGEGPPEPVSHPRSPPEARAEAVPMDAGVSTPNPEPPRPPPSEAAPTEAERASDRPTKPETKPETNATAFAANETANVSAGLPRDPHLRWRAIQSDPDPFVRNVLARLRAAESVEPYHQVGAEWRRAPWAANPYESIGPGYARAEDMPRTDAAIAEAKLVTSLPDGWMDLPPDPPRPAPAAAPPDETPCLVCGRADDEASFVLCESCPKGGHFRCLNLPGVPEGDWFCPACGGPDVPAPRARSPRDETKRDAARETSRDVERVAPSDDAAKTAASVSPAPAPAPGWRPNAKPLWENRVPLKLGVDVEERPMWGMDCYTRVAIDAALSQASSFAGTDPAAVSRREAFFSEKLMPAVHSLWKDGWDLKLAVRRVEEEARESRGLDLDATLEACRCIARAIEEVDEAGLDTHPPPPPPKGGRAGAASRAGARAGKSGAERSASYVPPGVRIKRPLGAYMIYANEARPGLVAAHPPEWARDIAAIGKALGAGWKALSGEERAKYAARAAAAKKQFEEVDLPAAIKRAEEEEEARVEAEALKEKRAREAAAAAAAAVVAAREERLKKRADEAAATAAAREERLLNRAARNGETIRSTDGGADGTPPSAQTRPSRPTETRGDAAETNGRAPGEAEEEATATATAAERVVEQRFLPPNRRAAKRRHFRLHPKGVGVVCVRREGIPAGTYVQDYLGELYAPWRWYERQDAIKKRDPNKALPDFFNITLERPKEDDAGADVIFVEAAHRCTFASRLSHSCAPNCQTVVLAVDGKLTIAQYTTRDIAYGEELCWNYSCVTESEKEYRAAICLCSSTRCKGAFLDYAGSSSFTAVMGTRHNFCDRNAILIRACSEKVTADDRAALARAGIKSAALGMAVDAARDDDDDDAAEDDEKTPKPFLAPSPTEAARDDAGGEGFAASRATNDARAEPTRECPEWLVKWAALTLEYIETERGLLPDALMEKPLDGITYDRPFAEATAQGVAATRLTNLVVTLDKIKYALRQPGQCRAPFLRPLRDDEIVEHLWLGPHGIFRRAVDAMAASGAGPHALGAKGSEARTVLARLRASRDAAKFDDATDAIPHPSTPAEARACLRRVADMVRACGGEHIALADCLLLYAATERWVTPAPYVGFTSSAVRLTPLPKDAEYARVSGVPDDDRDAADAAPAVDGSPVGDPSRPTADSRTADSKAPAAPPKLAKRYRGDVANVMRKKYQQHFAWGQLVSWFKQTIYDPSASLSADRRGTMSLPDPESAYGGSKPGSYERSERKILLTHAEKNPDRAWPTTWRWSFRNPAKVYGSPFIDDAVRASLGEPRKTPELVRAMRET